MLGIDNPTLTPRLFVTTTTKSRRYSPLTLAYFRSLWGRGRGMSLRYAKRCCFSDPMLHSTGGRKWAGESPPSGVTKWRCLGAGPRGGHLAAYACDALRTHRTHRALRVLCAGLWRSQACAAGRTASKKALAPSHSTRSGPGQASAGHARGGLRPMCILDTSADLAKKKWDQAVPHYFRLDLLHHATMTPK